MQNPDRLPPRDLPRRRSGRHRNPLSFDSWVGTPTLVLAVPTGPAGERGDTGEDADSAADIGSQMVDLVRAYRPEVAIRHGRAGTGSLAEALADLGPREGHPLRGVVVPVVTAPHDATAAAINDAVAQTGADVRVTEALGPHPMLAEVVHLRLAEAGFVRADRMRLISVVAPGTRMTDGVVVGAAGGAEAVNATGVTAVLLAARLGITVLPADLGDTASLDHAFEQLRAAGCSRPVLAPSVVGPEFPAERLEPLAQRYGARACAPLGVGGTLAKIAALRYAEVLNTLGVETPPSVEELPAPVGSRHRRE
ncbi:cobalamin biosynthesis protein CbiX [Streptomonospora sp. S1-112]|uniref:Cobalamin biosynthesis protein CbiX n=1 Tax=Streptomonospora mangrovi TaxID=2883123 RepID=A0A9X3NQZ9_9ACTN|nr:cobalamin biosynthesis protein CbiX [Streptomonospora mangrovi]MDA0567550.1 cobalamin biosynthesis protein CbiX [Streptomonospora mangrovi]